MRDLFFGVIACSVSRHRTLMNVFDKAPVVDKDAFVAPSASIVGQVQVGRGSSIWYGCVLRGKTISTNLIIYFILFLLAFSFRKFYSLKSRPSLMLESNCEKK